MWWPKKTKVSIPQDHCHLEIRIGDMYLYVDSRQEGLIITKYLSSHLVEAVWLLTQNVSPVGTKTFFLKHEITGSGLFEKVQNNNKLLSLIIGEPSND